MSIHSFSCVMNAQTQSELFLLETFDLISSTTILGAFYGIAFTLYCLCARLLYLQLRERNQQRQARFTLVIISLTLLCTTIYLALNARIIQLAYINHSDFPGGPLAYETLKNPVIGPHARATGIIDMVVKVMMLAVQVSHRSNSSMSLNAHHPGRSGVCG